MGRDNRPRRAAKQRARRREHQQPHPGNSGGGVPRNSASAGHDRPHDLVHASARAVELWAEGREAAARDLVESMIGHWGVGNVAARFDRMVDGTLDALWEHGWQPETARITARKRGKAAAVLVGLIAANSRAYRHAPDPEPDWMAQLAGLGADKSGRTLAEQTRTSGGRGVDVFLHAVFPHLRSTGGPFSNHAGYAAGYAAGEVASLGLHRRLEHRTS